MRRRPARPERSRHWTRWARRLGWLLLLLACLGGIYSWQIEPRWLEIVRIELELPHLAPAFDGFKLVQLSDLHIDSGMPPARLTRIVRLANREQADVIALTGDFVTAPNDPAQSTARLTAALEPLQAQELVAYVLGNHDCESRPELVQQALDAAGIADLNNAVRTLRRDGESLHMAGLDDIWAGRDRLDRVLAALPVDGAAILLFHEPDFADRSAATGRFDLQLAGHSHGGQVRLPLIGPPFLPPYGREYPLGRYQFGDTIHYTNRGLGMTILPIRWRSRPEITVFTLRSPLSRDQDSD
ncbi:MAG: metallophosphoesterase [Spirulinaceae cyanobacterium SM2_1_0]|nr:metallophosphoesterase [Spirulinaceae cyanobacterium SM2_1_0]